jgi:hypothetical protein
MVNRGPASNLLDVRVLPIHSSGCPIPNDVWKSLVQDSLKGDPQARIHYFFCYVDFQKLPLNYKHQIAKELIQYIQSGVLGGQWLEIAVMELGDLPGLNEVRKTLHHLAEEETRPIKLRRVAMHALAWHLSGNPDSSEISLIRRFLRSPDEEDRLESLWVIQIGQVKQCSRELIDRYHRESSLKVRASILETFGWVLIPEGFELVMKESSRGSAEIRKGAAKALSLYATDPETLTESQVERLRVRLNQLSHDAIAREEANSGLYYLKRKKEK